MSWLIMILAGSICGLSTARLIDLPDSDTMEYDVIEPNYVPPNMNDTHFYLWTRDNPESNDYYEMMNDDIENLENSPFADYKRTYFLMHGWGGSGFNGYILDIKDELLKWSNCQVISIDYEVAADPVNYDKAVYNTYFVAEYVGSFIDFLTTSTTLKTDQIHITGHSLGGQGAGLVAKNVKTGLIDRVSALDPAGPLFYNKSPERRLDKSDAAFVDVVHTNGCALQHSCEGEFRPLGHADFYPNGGRHQAGCIPAALDFFTGCSHGRSHDYWIESIKAPYDSGFTDQFWAYKCLDYETFLNRSCTDQSTAVVMGFRATRNLQGSFFLDTRRKSPFAKGEIKA